MPSTFAFCASNQTVKTPAFLHVSHEILFTLTKTEFYWLLNTVVTINQLYIH